MIGLSIPIDTTAASAALVPAYADNRIKVISFLLVVGGATNVKFTDGAGGSSLCGQMNFGANGGMVSQGVNDLDQKEYLMQTSVNTALVITNSATQQIGGLLRYYIDKA